MSVRELVELVKKAAEGADDFEKGAAGSNGYGFVFKDSNSGLPYIKLLWSSQFCQVGSMRNFEKNLNKRVNEIESLEDMLNCRDYDNKHDMLLLGSLKTLVPTLQFGSNNDEIWDSFFDAWMFVRTPDGKQFPATLYYKRDAISVGCWKSLKSIEKFYKKSKIPRSEWASEEIDEDIGKTTFPKEFQDEVNCSPLEFTKEERNMFIDALEFALSKVPISDFYGFHYEDICMVFMGVYENKPFMRFIDYPEKEYPEYEKKLELLLDKTFMDEGGSLFKIRKLPLMGLYYIEELGYKLYGYNFGNAKKIYEQFNSKKVDTEKIQIPTSLVNKLKKKYEKEGFSDDCYLSEHISWIVRFPLEQKIKERKKGVKILTIEEGMKRLFEYLKRKGFYDNDIN